MGRRLVGAKTSRQGQNKFFIFIGKEGQSLFFGQLMENEYFSCEWAKAVRCGQGFAQSTRPCSNSTWDISDGRSYPR